MCFSIEAVYCCAMHLASWGNLDETSSPSHNCRLAEAFYSQGNMLHIGAELLFIQDELVCWNDLSLHNCNLEPILD